MISNDHKYIICDIPGCEESIRNHYWGSVKKGQDWFFSRQEDKAFCPKHIPSWVETWRKKKRG